MSNGIYDRETGKVNMVTLIATMWEVDEDDLSLEDYVHGVEVLDRFVKNEVRAIEEDRESEQDLESLNV